MPYLPEDLPVPVTSLDTEAWWKNCAERRLTFQQCEACRMLRHPPAPICPHCHAPGFGWARSTGAGRVYSFSWVHHPFTKGLAERESPWNVSLITFEDAPGVRLVSNVIDATSAELRIDLPVELVWEEQSGWTLPRFRKT